jgi:hypothetical protein
MPAADIDLSQAVVIADLWQAVVIARVFTAQRFDSRIER